MTLSCVADFHHRLEDTCISRGHHTQWQKGERRRSSLMCFLHMKSWGWASASKRYCLKTRSDTSCDCLKRVGGRGRGRDSTSLKEWAPAAVKQRARGKQYHQRGPCVLLFWTNTVGPPSGWVPQPGSMWPERDETGNKSLCETGGKKTIKKTVLLFLAFAK